MIEDSNNKSRGIGSSLSLGDPSVQGNILLSDRSNETISSQGGGVIVVTYLFIGVRKKMVHSESAWRHRNTLSTQIPFLTAQNRSKHRRLIDFCVVARLCLLLSRHRHSGDVFLILLWGEHCNEPILCHGNGKRNILQQELTTNQNRDDGWRSRKKKPHTNEVKLWTLFTLDKTQECA